MKICQKNEAELIFTNFKIKFYHDIKYEENLTQ